MKRDRPSPEAKASKQQTASGPRIKQLLLQDDSVLPLAPKRWIKVQSPSLWLGPRS